VIVVFGSVNVDLVFAVETLPAPGETVLTDAYAVHPGGKGANQAVAAARAGAAVAMVGCVGSDGFGESARNALAAAGVDVGLLGLSERATGCAAIGVDAQGRNAITVASGANLDAAHDRVPDKLLAPGTVLLLQNEVRMEQNLLLARRAAARGARVVLNAAPARPLRAKEWAGLLHALVVNEAELADIVGPDRAAEPARAAGGLAERLGATVIATLGEAGSVAATRNGAGWRIGALPLERAVDTTAAGDCFVGVYGQGLAAGLDAPAALRRASVAAGLACTAAGAQPSLPGAAAIDAHLDRLPPATPL
jgi:ribokinase